jgi:arabinose-5-phosphate isomerase
MSFKEFCRVLEVEARELTQTHQRFLNDPQAAQSVEKCISLVLDRTQKGGKVLVVGVGKSGKIAAKFAATLSSTGTPAIYLHPTEAMHGDLGVLHEQDVAFGISYTGNTDELVSLLPFFESRKIPFIGLGGQEKSKMGDRAQIWISASIQEEACPHHLAPTTSTTIALAITDALAVGIMQARGFSATDFAKNHPGGSLGRRLNLRVENLMHPLQKCPVASPSSTMDEVLELSTRFKLGAVLVIQEQNLAGIITDGDIRRALRHREKFFGLLAQDIMTSKPISVAPDGMAFDALRLMEERESQINVLPVINAQGHAQGLLRIHDLVQTL